MNKDENVKVILEIAVMGDWGSGGIGLKKSTITVPQKFLHQSNNMLYHMVDYLLTEAELEYIKDKKEKEKDEDEK